MSGFIQPQWSGFGPQAAPSPVSGEADRQPSGLDVGRTLLGRPAKAAPPPNALTTEPTPVTPASPPPSKA
ncbi:MAG: hypothetical protein ACRCU1_13530 [Alsobacter sp.]